MVESVMMRRSEDEYGCQLRDAFTEAGEGWEKGR